MEQVNLLTTLLLAFGLGMLHALDADHVMAVTGLASARSGARPGVRAGLRFCLRWAIGHGLTVFTIASAVLLLGMAVPQRLSAVAESLVGLLLIAIGLWVIVELLRQRAHLHFHAHDGLPAHAHWHVHPASAQHDRCIGRPDHKHDHRHEHGAVLVGVLHGMAGSAPLFALIPIAGMHNPVIGLVYVGLFSLGVLLAMALFGGLLSSVFSRLNRWGRNFVLVLRCGVALGSIGYGAVLLHAGF